MKSRRQFLGAGAALTMAAVLSACGGGGHDMGSMGGATSSVAASADHNQADVAFAQGMIPHHAQAIEMADLVPSRASDPKVKELATQIKAAQDPEIATMKGWLQSWGQPVPASMSGMDHGSGSGMMSASEMKDLENANGAAFDKLFLTLMVKHHEGAVAMAKKEQASGKYAPAKDLAGQIIAAQEKEIATMKGLLGGS